MNDLIDSSRRAGLHRVAPPAENDVVDGLTPRAVVRATSTPEVAQALAWSAQHDLALVARGQGTKLDFGGPPRRVDLIVDVSGLREIIEHAPADFVVRAEAGVTLASLQETLRPLGQRLPIDDVVPGSTVGGLVATALSGPRRLLDGTVRDHLLGVTVVRADGVVARSGSKVVKNVAGYDLAKLLTGSLGTLGIITEAIFRLRPLPARQVFVSSDLDVETALAPVLAALAHSQAVPSAIEIAYRPPQRRGTLAILVEGRDDALSARVDAIRALLPGAAAISPEPPPAWGRLPGPLVIKLAVQLSLVAQLPGELARLAAATGISAEWRGSAGSGVTYLGLDGDVTAGQLRSVLNFLRERVAPGGGSAIVLRAPTKLKADVDLFGPVPGLSLMERVKARFDPAHRLAPGRFVGGW